MNDELSPWIFILTAALIARAPNTWDLSDPYLRALIVELAKTYAEEIAARIQSCQNSPPPPEPPG
jgi:hypothetical protein